ncbi:MAG: anaerobic ribonucleoside-triphosphate reductase activating protein [Clostridia bacterium]|nr:anaerobic ribonucleoside-triphosphate reductase activating protein [Clostridia bacterium]
MKIKGLQKLTLLDFPEKLACTVFLGGCNFRCPFCHNASLVRPESEGDDISEGEFFSFLESRRGRLRGVCVSGGEPTLHRELPEFLKKIKALGFAVKLDTNGYRPEVLRELLSEGLVDYVAMDIKSSPEGYGRCVGIEAIDLKPIYESAAQLMEGKVDFEFRTTVVKELHTKEDIVSIGRWLAGEESFFLQSFKDSGDILCEGMSAYSDGEMRELESALREYIPRAVWRG